MRILKSSLVITFVLFLSGCGCNQYASDYSCFYVEKLATYDVYYWQKVHLDNPADERYIGTVTGLKDCRDMAMRQANILNEPWNSRSYICMLMKDGRKMEKHRYLTY